MQRDSKLLQPGGHCPGASVVVVVVVGGGGW